MIFQTGNSRAFTLVELLATIAVLAALTTGALFFVPSYIQWARQNADHLTYTVLNDALTRYKTEGGNMSLMTPATPVGSVLSAMQQAITCAGFGHQVLQPGFTYPARSLQAAGTGSQYHFYQVGSYAGDTPAATTPTTAQPYGGGVGYMSNGGVAPYAIEAIAPSTGYWAYKDSSGNVVGPLSSVGTYTIPQGPTSITFWSCSSSSTTPSGSIVGLGCWNDSLTSLNVRGLTELAWFYPDNNPIGYLDVSHNPALAYLECPGCNLTTLDVSHNTALVYLDCPTNHLTSLNVTGLTSLPAHSTDGSTNFWTDPGVTIIGP